MRSPIHMTIVEPAVNMMINMIAVTASELKVVEIAPALWNVTMMPMDWITARPIAMKRVIFVIFSRPSSPSLESRSNRGIINVNNCMMMKLLMNGKIPSANSVPYWSAPPDIRLIMPSRELLLDNASCTT